MVEHSDTDAYRRTSGGTAAAASATMSPGRLGNSIEAESGTGAGIELARYGLKSASSDDGGSRDGDEDDGQLLSPLVGSLNIEKDALLTAVGAPHVDDGHGALPPGSANTTQLVINIVISFVGAGLLGIPYAMQKSGWLLGSICLLIVSGLNLYAMLLLPQVQKILVQRGFENCNTYGDLGRCIMGPAGEILVNVCLCVSQVGFATAYIIFIAANLYSIAQFPRGIVCLVCIPGLCILVQFRELKHLSPFSLLANCSNFAALSAVLFQDLETYQPHNDAIHAVKWDGFLYIIAVTLYSIEGVGMVLSLEASCKDRSSFPKVLAIVCSCIALFMSFFGSAGYLAFGDQTMAPITLNLAGHWSSTFVKCALCLGLYLTYPIMMFPVWATTETFVPRMKTEATMRVPFRCCLVIASTFVAYSFPHFGEFLGLVGSSICTILGLILPCYFSLSVQRDVSPYWKICLNLFLMIGGAIFGIKGTYNSLTAMMNGEPVGEG